MGKRGPAPAPTNLRLLHGEDKKNPGRVNRNEPKPADAVIKPPTWLSREARKVWRHLAPDLIAKKCLTAWDVEAFAGYCDAVVRRAEAAAHLSAEGEVVESPVFAKSTGEITGYRMSRNPWAYAFKDADNQVQRWGARFGLTPSERGQIKLPQGGASGDDLLS